MYFFIFLSLVEICLYVDLNKYFSFFLFFFNIFGSIISLKTTNKYPDSSLHQLFDVHYLQVLKMLNLVFEKQNVFRKEMTGKFFYFSFNYLKWYVKMACHTWTSSKVGNNFHCLKTLVTNPWQLWNIFLKVANIGNEPMSSNYIIKRINIRKYHRIIETNRLCDKTSLKVGSTRTSYHTVRRWLHTPGS